MVLPAVVTEANVREVHEAMEAFLERRFGDPNALLALAVQLRGWVCLSEELSTIAGLTQRACEWQLYGREVVVT